MCGDVCDKDKIFNVSLLSIDGKCRENGTAYGYDLGLRTLGQVRVRRKQQDKARNGAKLNFVMLMVEMKVEGGVWKDA